MLAPCVLDTGPQVRALYPTLRKIQATLNTSGENALCQPVCGMRATISHHWEDTH